ncbi:glycerophosphodiester phosphodiesterase [Sporosarcina sp. CAU 1771]
MDIYAHRGSSGTHPENTLAAFKEAARLPVYGVEFDVHMTKDGELVIIHDESINRTSNGKGYVKDMTFAELRKFDYGKWFSSDFEGEMIPTLEEVFAVFASTNHHLNIELKSDIFPYEGMAKKVVDLVYTHGLQDRVVISSFDHETVQLVKQLAPNIETGALFMEVLVSPTAYIRKIPANALHLCLPAALRKSAKEAIEEGIPVRVFTVNEEKYADLLLQAGIHAIFTDYPEKMQAYLTK